MEKEVITDKQGIILVTLFVMGSAVIIFPGIEARKDVWLAVLIAVIATLPVAAMYARLLHLFPGYDLFDILQTVLGKTAGKAVSALYIWFAFHLGALVLYNFGTFIETVGLPMTPMVVPMTCIAILSAWGVKEGIKLLGRWGGVFLPIVLIILIVSFLLLIPKMDINQIRPILYEGLEPLLSGAFNLFAFPFAETVIFTMVFYSLKTKKSAYKIYMKGLILTGIFGVIMAFIIVTVLGADYASSIYFPSYVAFSRMSVGNFLQRLEIAISIAFLITGFIKVSICLLAACRGISKLFGVKDYKIIVTPIVLLMLILSNIIYDNIKESYEWAMNIWPYYAFIFQIILPAIVLIAAEIKKRVGQRNQSVT